MSQHLKNLFGASGGPSAAVAGSAMTTPMTQEEQEFEEDMLPAIPEAPILPTVNAQAPSTQNAFDDFDFARRTLQSMMERSQQLVEIAIESAADSRHARDVEVASGAINTAVETARKLLDLQKQMKDLSQSGNSTAGTGNTFIHNNTVVMTTAELLQQVDTMEVEPEEDIQDAEIAD